MTPNGCNIFIDKSLLFFPCQLDIPTGICNCRTGIERVTEDIIKVGKN